jgi:acyl dehydratase
MSVRYDLPVGAEIPSLSKGPVTRQMLVEWCAAENDYYPLHYDERLAQKMNLPGTPIQGTYRYALMGQMISRWLLTLKGTGSLVRISASYRGLDLEGDVITARGRISGWDSVPDDESFRVQLDIWIENARGENSTGGTATVEFPKEAGMS